MYPNGVAYRVFRRIRRFRGRKGMQKRVAKKRKDGRVLLSGRQKERGAVRQRFFGTINSGSIRKRAGSYTIME
jgi:hypothetical protein